MVSSLDMSPPTSGFYKEFVSSQFGTKAPKFPSHVDLTGKTAVVTGSNVGIGFEACRQLLTQKLSRLIMAVRSVEKGNEAADKLRAMNHSWAIDVWELDMNSYESVQAFVRRCANDLPRLDIVILNAGLVRPNRIIIPLTKHEEVFQVNYLSTAFLTILLLPVLQEKSRASKSGPARLTMVSSGMTFVSRFLNRHERPLLSSFDTGKWDPVQQYSTSKLLCQLFVAKLAGYVSPKDVIVSLVDPGLVKGTALHREATGGQKIFFSVLKQLTARSLEDGASTYIDAVAVKGEESHGSYVANWKIRP